MTIDNLSSHHFILSLIRCLKTKTNQERNLIYISINRWSSLLHEYVSNPATWGGCDLYCGNRAATDKRRARERQSLKVLRFLAHFELHHIHRSFRYRSKIHIEVIVITGFAWKAHQCNFKQGFFYSSWHCSVLFFLPCCNSWQIGL